MTQSDSRRVPRAAVLAGFAAALTLLMSVEAQAQFGGLIKKAAEKATGQEAGAAPRPIGAELTDDMITRLIKGLAITASTLGQRDELAKREQTVAQQASDLSMREDGAIRGYGDIRARWEACQSDQFEKIDDEHGKAAEARTKSMMSDPARMNAYVATQTNLSMAYATAMQKGDTAAMRVAQQNMISAQAGLTAADLKADTAKVDRLCGGAPTRPLAVAQVDSLRALDAALTKQIRVLEEQAQEHGASAAGMNLVEYGTAREKVVSFKAGAKGQLTTAELQRLRAREADFAPFKRAL